MLFYLEPEGHPNSQGLLEQVVQDYLSGDFEDRSCFGRDAYVGIGVQGDSVEECQVVGESDAHILCLDGFEVAIEIASVEPGGPGHIGSAVEVGVDHSIREEGPEGILPIKSLDDPFQAWGHFGLMILGTV